MLREGFCEYCNQPKLVDVPEDFLQEQVDEAVTKNAVA